MSSIQIYAGLAPLALGLIGLVLAQLELRKIRQRKARKRAIFYGSHDEPFYAQLPTPNRRAFEFRIASYSIAVVFACMIAAAFIEASIQFNLFDNATALASKEILAKDAIGSAVLDEKNRKIGEIADILMNENGRDASVVVSKNASKTGKIVNVPLASFNWQHVQGDTDEEDAYQATVKNEQIQKR